MPKVKAQKLVLGITGGIASGKTKVMRFLARVGIPTVSSDDLAHQAIRQGTPVYRRVLKRFGRGILRSSGQICRTDLGNIVFRHPPERRWLERQIHPVVIKKLKQFIRAHHGVMALDIPLLFEARLQKLVDKTIVVYCSQAQQVDRLRRRNGLSRQEALRRIAAQMPLSAKRGRASFVILNTGSVAHLEAQIARLLKKSLTSKRRQV
jgi:dephospho-CoA kinase